MAGDPFPRLIHQLDQFGAALEQFAPRVAAYYHQLVALEMPPDQAIKAAIAMQTQLLHDTFPALNTANRKT